MKSFLIKISMFLMFLSLIAIGIFLLADGNSDSYYTNFTSSKQSSLILGTSKAAQGLQPAVINGILNRSDVNNFAFTVAHSPYGPVYLEAIKKKIDRNTKDGIFIVTVDPYSVSSRHKDANDVGLFRENDKFLATVSSVTSNPNFEYLYQEYSYPYIYILTKKFDYIDDDFLHPDGWNEVNISMKQKDFEVRNKSKIKSYKKLLKVYKFSDKRYEYFEKTISFLKEYGKVYLVRLPVSTEFLEMENSVYPEFDSKLSNTSSEFNVPFLDLTKEYIVYKYTDGNHLYKTSGTEVSEKIAKFILNYK
ncbi:hypothetical protein [Gillisia sp. Hel1_33_143]|uniref:hypothetical protein n=1 Tax=Gillisia sp. Hel1_33_143 TaxID=1336796 RepID=UPI0012FD17EF|nr:hypothetical protein [Gillisia sp. Hel1_33_143]